MGRRDQITLRSILLATALLGGSRAAWAYDIGYGGRLAAPDGAPIAGPLNLVFHFYRGETSPTPTLTLAKASVPLVDGIFQVSLSLTPPQLNSIMGNGSESIYIEVEALGRRYPKQVFSYVPLALRVPVDGDKIVYDDLGRLTLSDSATADTLTKVSKSGDTMTGLLSLPSNGLRVGTNQLVTAGGNIGIGSASPGATLDVNGTVRAASFESTSGASNFSAQSIHNVASISIGTTSVGSDLTFGSGADRILSVLPSATAGNSLTVQAGGTTATTDDVHGGNLVLASGTASGTGSSKIEFKTASGGAPATSMTILGNGNVGIGTSMPTTKLSVDGNANFSGNVTVGADNPGLSNVLRLFNNASTDSNSHAVFQVQTFPGGGNSLMSLGLQGITNWYFAADRSADGALKIGRTGASPAAGLGDLVTISRGGSVGIGTTSPSALFHLSSTTGWPMKLDASQASTSVSMMAGPKLSNTDQTTNNWIGVSFADGENEGALGGVGMQITDHSNNFGDIGFATRGTSGYAERMRIHSNGNVGIGTTAPTQALDVAGTIRSSTGGFMFPDGSMMSSALPTPSSGYSSTTDLNMAADFGGNGTGNMVMSTRGTERLRITNGGNIGIGSTAPGAKIEVVSGGAAAGLRVLSGSSTNLTGYALGRTSTEAMLGIAASADSLVTGSVPGDVVLRTEGAAQRLMFSNGIDTPTMTLSNSAVTIFNDGSSSPTMTVRSGGVAIGSYADSDLAPSNGVIVSGSVGVGTNAPSQPLEVAGIIKSSAGGFMFPDGSVMMSAATPGTSGTSSTTDLNLVADSAVAGTGDVIVSTKGAERMRVTNAGNIGIGTSAPGDRLMVRATKDSTVTPQLPGLAVVDSSLANQGVGGGIALWGNYTGTTPISGATIHAMKAAATAGDTGFNLAFNTRVNGGGLTEKMRITSSGNVGIGTVSPVNSLTVNGTSNFTGNMGIGTTSPTNRLSVAGTANITGNVGIGTTAPTRALDVNGVVRASGGFMFPDGTLMTTAATSSSSSSGGGTSSETTLTLAADTGASGNGVIAMTTAGVERMRVANNGNVGIGTTVPVKQLTIGSGTDSFTASASGIGVNFPGGSGIFMRDSTNHVEGKFEVFSSRLGVGTITNHPLDLWTNNVNRLTVTESGNVGIGTKAPTNLLDLSRGSSGSSTDQLILRNGGTTTTASTGAGLAFALTNASAARHAAINAVVSNAATGGTDLTFSTQDTGTSATEKVRIKAGGFVGIGTSSPANELSVAGGADFTGNVGIGSNIPARALDVVGVVRASAGIEFPDGTTMTTAAAAGTGTSSTTDLSFAADSDADGSGVISLATRGSERIRVGNTGNVGIGTSAPADILHVVKSGTGVSGGLIVQSGSAASANNVATLVLRAVGGGGGAVDATMKSYYTGSTYALGIDTVNSGYPILMQTVNNGNVGIGTTAPGSRLQVNGNAAIGYSSATAAPANGLAVSGNVGIGTASPANTLSVNGTANITGNVGIGTTTASQPLEVAGSIKLSSAGSLIFPDGTSMSTAAAASTGSSSTTDLAFSADSDGDGSGILTMATRGTERLRLDSNGNLGIGTTAPTGLLTLQTTSGLDGINLVSGASSSSPAYSLYDGPTERGVFGLATAAAQRSSSALAGDIVLRATSGKLLLQTGTADATMILNNGNVGIGTTTPAALLDVSGARFSAPTITGAYIGLAGPILTDNVTAASATATNMAFNAIASPTLAATNSSVTTTNAYTAYIGGAPKKGNYNTVTNAVALGIGAAAVGAQTNSYGLLVNTQTGATNNYAAVFQGGNVGIGSAAPTQRLDVAGAIRSSSGGFVFPDGSVMTTAITPTTGGTSSTTDLNLAADTEGTGNGAVIVSTGTVERMRVVNSGNIGIATSTPVNTLSVNGTANFTDKVGIGTTSPSSNLHISGMESVNLLIEADTDNGPSEQDVPTLLFSQDGGAVKARIGINSSNQFNIIHEDSSSLILGTANQGRVWVTSSGSVGIATTAPSSKLQIVGNASVGYVGQTSAPSNGLLVNGSVGIGTTSPGSKLQVSGNAAIGYSTATAGPTNGLAVSGNLGIGSSTPGYKLDVVGDINSTTCVRIAGTQQLGTCASDERFKKNITPITGALAKLRLLSPVHYEFRSDEYPSRNFSHAVEAGLIAQELERVFPHLVMTDDDGYKRVRYGLDLNMQTIAAVKELALENDQLKAETIRLRARADQAEATVTTLQAKTEKLEAESATLRAFLCEQFPSAPMCAP